MKFDRHSVHDQRWCLIFSASRMAARLLRWMLCIGSIVFVAKFGFEMKSRLDADKRPERWWSESATVQGVHYTAKLVFVSQEEILLRLYRQGDATLLAERIYREAGVALRWSPSGWLIYDTSDDSFLGGAIQLPPTRLDNLLAKLP